jgi:hypothetical protein
MKKKIHALLTDVYDDLTEEEKSNTDLMIFFERYLAENKKISTSYRSNP